MTELTDAFGEDDLSARASRIRGLARLVASDPNDSDDLAQELMLRELERRPRGAAPSSLAWLFVALRNLAGQRRRGNARRAARERAVARGERVPGPEEALQHAETMQRVVAAVLALDPPHRTVILLRHVEGRSVREVARATGVPDATVRVRTMRAIRALRERLARDLGRGWALLLLDLAGADRTAVGPASRSPSVPAHAGWIRAMKTMKIRLTLVTAGLGAAALALSGLAQESRHEPGARRATGPLAAAEVPLELEAPPPARARAEVPALAAGTRDGNQAFVPPPLAGTVVDHLGRPVAAASVRVFSRPFEGAEAFASGDPLPAPELALTDASGAWSIATLHPFAAWGIEARAPGFAPTLHTQRPGADTAITLFPAADLRGVVRDADTGMPLSGVAVRVLEPSFEGERVRRSRETRTDGRGAYRMDVVRAESGLQVELLRPGAASCRAFLTLRAGADNVQDFALGGPADLDVVVLAADTLQPIAGAAVYDQGLEREFLGRTGHDGRLRVAVPMLDGAPPATEYAQRSHLLAHAEGYCATSAWLPPVGRDAAGELQLRLVRSGRVTGIVRDRAGRPVADAHVAWQAPPLCWVEPRGAAGVAPDSESTRTGADGRFALEHVPASAGAMEGELRAFKDGRVAVVGHALPRAAGTTRELELTLGAGVTLAGRTTVNGRPTAACVRVESADGAGRVASTQSAKDGRYAFFDLAPGAYEVRAYTRDGTALAGPSRRVEVAAAIDDLDLEIHAELAFVHGRVLLDDGTPAAGRKVLAFETHRGAARVEGGEGPQSFELTVDVPDGSAGFQRIASVAEVQADGRFELALPPDARARYRLGVYQGGFGIAADGVWPGAREVEIRLPRLVPVAVELARASDGSPVESAGLRWLHAATRRDVTLAWAHPRVLHGGVLVLELPPGTVELRVRDGLSGREARALVQVAEDGPTERVRIEL